MSIIPKFYVNAIVSMGVLQSDQNIAWIGTGFFVVRRVDDENLRPFLVTNKHVLENNSIID